MRASCSRVPMRAASSGSCRCYANSRSHHWLNAVSAASLAAFDGKADGFPGPKRRPASPIGTLHGPRSHLGRGCLRALKELAELRLALRYMDVWKLQRSARQDVHISPALSELALNPLCPCARRRPRHTGRANGTPFPASAQSHGRPPHRTNPLNAACRNAQAKARSCAPGPRP